MKPRTSCCIPCTCPLDTLDPFLDARLLDTEIDAIMKVIERRATDRVPAAYITHEAWMHGHRFYVDERVIVPRSFIGELLQDGLQPYVQDPDEVSRVLELCTGSGSSRFSPRRRSRMRTSTPSISPHPRWKSRTGTWTTTTWIRASHCTRAICFAPLPVGRYEVIITNPPYVNALAMQTLPAEYRHEPELALAGGADGMDIVKRIVGEARKWLTEDGVLVVEIGNERANVEATLGGLDIVWLSTSAGDDNVFLIQAADLPG